MGPIKVIQEPIKIAITAEVVKDIEHILMFVGYFIKNPKNKRKSINLSTLKSRFVREVGWTHSQFLVHSAIYQANKWPLLGNTFITFGGLAAALGGLIADDITKQKSPQEEDEE